MKESDLKVASWIELLGRRASEEPDRRLYTFLANGEEEEGHLSYRDLDRQARAIGALLQANGAAGERALLLYPPGLDFIAAFFGCLYGGGVAVPAYPPRVGRGQPRLRAIARDAATRVVLTVGALAARADLLVEEIPELRSAVWLATDGLPPGLEEGWRDPGAGPGTLAFLQYTSGSTADPKGVMVSHGNLLHNEEMISRAFGQSRDSVVVGWLPLYHDMGLIGNVMQPLYVGGQCILMSPAAFLQRPLRWLEAVSRYRATTSGGPNFAYELCVRRLGAHPAEGLDLSSWILAYNGAEPVRAETLERFAAACAPYGFDRRALYPCYGLAEATLFVSGGSPGRGPVVETVDPAALEKGLAVPAAGGRELVGCGSLWMGQEVRIADPETGEAVPPGRVGEIQVAGPSLAQGYWHRPEESAATFVELPDGRRFLRTGDLGFLHGDELFVTGRLKDLIILRGRNLYPQDVELSAERSHAALRPGCSAAFSTDAGGEERLVVVCEVERGAEGRTGEMAASIRQAVAEEHDAQVYEVVFLPAGEIPKTSSGKIQRRACRASYLAGELSAIGRSALGAAEASSDLTAGAVEAEAIEVEGATPEERIGAWLRKRLARRFGLPVAAVALDQPLTSLGLDSLSAVELQHAFETELQVEVGVTELLEGPTVRELATLLASRLGGERRREEAVPRAASITGELPLSYGQRALWFLQRLQPESSAYNIAAAVRVRSGLDVDTLRRAWGLLAMRHEALRASFPETADGPVQRIQPDGGPGFFFESAEDWSAERLRERLHQEAQRPFDLQAEPLVRIGLFGLAGGEHAVILVVHHIVADLWSLAVLLRELGVVYAALRAGGEPRLDALPLRYPEAVERQLRRLQGDEGERLWDYWRERLGGGLPVAELPTDRPRPPVQGFRGGSRSLWLDRSDRGLAGRLHGLGRDRRATLFTTLLALFQTLLHRYSGQTDLVVGSPTAGRETPDSAGLVGYFVNPVALRTDVAGEPSFTGLLDRARETVLAAFRHQELPFPLLVERLQPERDASRSPLFQVMFVLQSVHLPELRDLPAFALGQEGVKVGLGGEGGLTVESLALEYRAAQFDLELMAAETERGLALTLIYDADLFDGATAERALGHLATLARGAAARPEADLGELPLLTVDEQAQIAAWNQTHGELPDGGKAGFTGLFEEQAARTPDRVAAEEGAASLTYAELNARANRLARTLLKAGIAEMGAEEPVAVWADRGLDFLTAVIAILKAGGAYLPLDPRQPAPRLVQMLRRSRCRTVLASEEHLDACLAGLAQEGFRDAAVLPLRESIQSEQPDNNLGSGPAPDRLAYVLFTSGSTGLPKGAMLEHGGMLNHLVAKIRDLGLGPDDRLAQTAAPTFDISVWQLLAALLAGGRVRIVPDDVVADPARLLREVEEQGITVLEVVPSLLRAMLDEVRSSGSRPGLSSLRWLIPTGEALPPDLCQAWFASYPGIPMVNAYGPTECSDDVTHHVLTAPLPEGALRTPVGRPILNLRLHVVDRRLAALPVGVPGELSVAGIGVGRGYLDDPARTAEVFVPDPFATEPGRRLYRTGDLGLRRPDGILEVLGRSDHQVKIRGFRIEPGEIEAVLAEHPAVREVVVLARYDQRGEARLAACWTARPGVTAGSAELREHLRQRLPEAMVPSAFLLLDELPLTPNGKIDRKALPEPEWSGDERPAAQAPRDEIEALVAGAFAEVLGVDRIGMGESFFDAGGHSLLATQVVSRLRRTLGIDLPLRSLFEDPTPGGLAARIRLSSAEAAGVASPPLHRYARGAAAPLSFAQQRLWFLSQLEPESPEYNMPGEVRLSGPLSVPALAASLAGAVRRHEALRTVFRSAEGEPWQEVLPALDVALPVIDLSALPAADRERESRGLAWEESRRPFDLSRGPLLRAALVRLGDEEHRLLFTLHHIVSDGWSQGVLVREISAFYRAFAAHTDLALPELPIQYADFAQWQREWLQGEVLEAQLAYWRGALGESQPVLELLLDHPRPPRRTHRGRRRGVHVGAAASEALLALARREGATPFMAVMAVFQALLHRFSGQTDVRVGTPIANRRWEEVEGLIGFFVNTLVLRADLSGEPSGQPSLIDLIGQAREAALGGYAHQDVPFERLVDELQPSRDLSRTPLFQAMLILQNAPMQPLALAGLDLAVAELDNGTAKYELTLNLEETADGLRGWLEHNTDLFEPVTAERLLAGYRALLADGAARPGLPVGDLSILGEAERHQILREWAIREIPVQEDRRVHHLVEEQAALHPEAPAVFAGGAGGRFLTYGELNSRANRLARHLRGLGAGADVPVGICIDRSHDLVVSVLAVLKSGGAYLPLDPALPRERLAIMLGDSRAALVVTRRELAGVLPEGQAQPVLLSDLDLDSGPDDNLGVTSPGDCLAFILFTSGSTGRPKGVQLTQRAMLNTLTSMALRVPGLAGQSLLGVTTLSFDIGSMEICLPLMTGGQVILADREVPANGARLAAELARSGARFLQATPVTWRVLVESGWEGVPGLCALAAGEVLPRELAQRILARTAPGGYLTNGYGPTEATMYSTVEVVREDETGNVPIGRPVDNLSAILLDRNGQPVPVGVAGELFHGGIGVGRGYVGRPELTAERFVPDPVGDQPGARLYRTGDLVRWLPDGRMDYLGRMDQQVKVRGFRIELEEIETLLNTHPAVGHGVVVARGEGTERRLVAFVLPAGPGPLPISELRGILAAKLPEYMVPSLFVPLEKFPLTASGKVDRRALPDPGPVLSTTELVAPRSPEEEVLAGIWARVLGVDRVGIHDSFFEMGGHSLLATRVMSRIQEAFRVELPLRTLFENPTVAAMARVLAVARQERRAAPPIRRLPRDGQPLALSFAQERLWLMDQLIPDSPLFNVFQALRLDGPLDVAVLERSFGEVARRHESLRTTVSAVRGHATQVIHPPAPFELRRLDLTALDAEEQDREVARLAGEEARRPFKLRKGPLFRATLLELGPRSWTLLLAMHHIVCDDWSIGLLVREVAVLYEAFQHGQESPLSELAVQYADFAAWQREWLAGEVLAGELSYWTSRLSGLPVLDLPTDEPRPPVQSHRGATQPFELPESLGAALRRAGREEGVTLFMTLLAGFAVMLHRASGQDDLIVGSPVAGRNRLEIEPLIGFFVNILPLRIDLSGSPTWRELLRRVRSTALEAYDHQDLPFEKMVEALQVRRDLSRAPVRQVVFALQDAAMQPIELEELTVQPIEVDPGVARLDLTLFAWAAGEGLRGVCEYNTDIFHAATVERWLGLWRHALEDLVEGLDRPLPELAIPVPAEPVLALPESRALPETNLTEGQLLFWFAHKLQPDVQIWFDRATTAFTLLGDLDREAFAQAFQRLLEVCDVLRSRIVEVDGVPQRLVADRPPVPALEQVDLSQDAAPEAVLREMLTARSREPMAVAERLFHSALIRVAPGCHVWFFDVHHVIADAWSIRLLAERLSELYGLAREGRLDQARPFPPYEELVAEERQNRQSERYRRAQAYWEQKLAQPVAPNLFYRRTDTPESLRTARLSVDLPAATSATAREIAAERRLFSTATVFAGVLFAYLHRLSGERRLRVGTPFANRPERFKETVGLMMNACPLQIEIDEDETFSSLFEKLQQEIADASRHQHYPVRNPQQGRIHDVYFNVQPIAFDELCGLPVRYELLHSGFANDHLNLQVSDFSGSGSFRLDFDFRVDGFDEEERRRSLHHWLSLLESCLADPAVRLSEAALLSAEERREILAGFNATRQPYPRGLQLHELIEAQVERTPDAVAVAAEGQPALTYRELDRRGNQLARFLRAAGAQPDSLVGVAMERSLEMVVALAGILKAGAAYVPLDPGYPLERLQFMLEDARVPVLLTQSHLKPQRPAPGVRFVCLDTEWAAVAEHPADRLPAEGGEDALAYVIYTSGSTGRPKGTMIPHAGICNRLLWMQEAYGLTSRDCVLQKTPFSFDVSVWEFFWPLITGARLFMARPGGHQDPAYLVSVIEREKVTTLHFVPSMLQVFLEQPGLERCASVLRVICSGEALPDALRIRFHERMRAELHNLYGPTEASVDVTFWPCERESRLSFVPIGKPIANTEIHLLDLRLSPVPVGVPGELHIGGVSLARGYLRRPELTAERFVPDACGGEPGMRLYKTGDLARWLPDGNVEYLGRLDHQVKIRGFRIELGEIESVLAKFPGVREVVVMAREDRPGDKRLVAYFVPEPEWGPSPQQLRGYAQGRLPDHMVPAALVALEEMPLSPNGKVDRRRLPAPDPMAGAAGIVTERPRTPLEALTAILWTRVLGFEVTNLDANFFEIGGNSLLATQLIAMLQEVLPIELPLRKVFENPTVAGLARVIEEDQSGMGEQERRIFAEILEEFEQGISAMAV